MHGVHCLLRTALCPMPPQSDLSFRTVVTVRPAVVPSGRYRGSISPFLVRIYARVLLNQPSRQVITCASHVLLSGSKSTIRSSMSMLTFFQQHKQNVTIPLSQSPFTCLFRFEDLMTVNQDLLSHRTDKFTT